ncbi:MAG: phosphoglucosamine mutase [Clostridiales bacterium]|nr:phosphoglucosamine mutase [Clostridiales bacterium]
MGKLFGTDGVRGVANTELTAEMALALGRAGAYVLTKDKNANAPKVLVGKDTRRSGDMLEAALTAGLCSLGAEVYLAGVVPTPGVAYLVRKYGLDAGVMISASHNPMADNGIKFFNGEGYKLPDALEEEIEMLYEVGTGGLPHPTGVGIGTARVCERAAEDYRAYLLSTVPGLSLKGMKLAIDCANGATGSVAPALFKILGADVTSLFTAPDGTNINENCGSTHIGPLRDFAKQNGCDAAFAYDGDGDRLLCVDDTGTVVEGDEVVAICGMDLHRRGLLAHNAIVGTVMSNLGLSLMCREHGLTLYQTAVGDRYVLDKMLAGGFTLGGEQSGHIIFRQYGTTGDGILTSLQLLSVLRRENKTLSALKRVMEVVPQSLVNARVPNNRKFLWVENPAILALIEEAEELLGGGGRVLVRPSGTEPLIRVMIEGRDASLIDEWAKKIAAAIETELKLS